ncbi:MAG: translation elongation factor Ts [Buchnera aphidicola (Eriosoma harunire)]
MVDCIISASLVKELRNRTGVGVMECKRALLEEHGNLELAIDNLRKNGLSRLLKKNSNQALQGAIFLYTLGNIGSVLELNCETDFVSKNMDFIRFGKQIVKDSALNCISDINILKDKFEILRLDLMSRISENIVIKRISVIQGDQISSYSHMNRIGVLVSSNVVNNEFSKSIAMHIAANKPDYLFLEDVPSVILDREMIIQRDLVKKHNKSDFINSKIIDGQIKKFISEIVLLEQNFLFDSKLMVKEFLNKHSITLKSFVRFELGF